MSDASGSGLPPAGWYTDPHLAGAERWWDGTRWAEHTRAHTATKPVTPLIDRSHAAIACPRCGAREAKTLSMVRAQGTTTGTGTASGWVSDNDGSGGGHMATFRTQTTSYTGAARAAAPPVKKSTGLALIGLGIVVAAVLIGLGYMFSTGPSSSTMSFLPIYGVIAGAVLVIVGVILAPRDMAYNRDVYPDASTRYDRSWQCQRCGNVFLV